MTQLCTLALVALTASSAQAKPKRTAAAPAARSPARGQPPAAPVPPVSPVPDSAAATPQLLETALRSYEELDYDRARDAAAEVLTRADCDKPCQVAALRTLAYSTVVTRTVVDAEPPFRKLLDLQPEFEPAPNVSPSIVAAFRRVQVERRKAEAEQAQRRKDAMLSRLKLLDGLPTRGTGGRPLTFALRIRDPDSALATVAIAHRRPPERAFSTLALTRDETGRWVGELPMEFTVSELPYRFEVALASRSEDGVSLLTVGDERNPVFVEMEAGQIPRARPVPRAVFWTSFATTLAAAATSGGLGFGLWRAQARLDSTQGELPASQLRALRSQGESLALGTTIALISTAALAVITLALSFFVAWGE